MRITVIATGFEKTPFPKKEDKKASSERDWSRSFGSAAAGALYGSGPMVQQEYSAPSYDDMSFNMPMDEDSMGGFGYSMGGSAMPTPAAVPQMMQQQSYTAPYGQQPYQPSQFAQPEYGAAFQQTATQPVQQPVPQAQPQMEYGQQYQAMQPAVPQKEPVPQQPILQQPAVSQPVPQPAAPERSSLGVPAFLRRPTRK